MSFKQPKRSEKKRQSSPFDPQKIQQAAEQATGAELLFSFRYLDLSDEDFSLSDRDSGYFIKLFERKKALCGMRASEFRAAKGLRVHTIDFSDTARASFPSHIRTEELGTPFQFSLSSNEHGRVHGILSDRIFYVVWFDPDHKLYPGK